MSIYVIILGGGVAGMSAAHRITERDFSVTVFEKQAAIPGGKARSFPIESPAPPREENLYPANMVSVSSPDFTGI